MSSMLEKSRQDVGDTVLCRLAPTRTLDTRPLLGTTQPRTDKLRDVINQTLNLHQQNCTVAELVVSNRRADDVQMYEQYVSSMMLNCRRLTMHERGGLASNQNEQAVSLAAFALYALHPTGSNAYMWGMRAG